MTATVFSLPLPTRLKEFELTGVLGEGGFSVVYTALDHSLERTVAIKEYMPSAIASRLPDGTVLPKSPKHEDTFRAGLASFLNEARLLAKFTHPALVHIHRVWEQNGTAYIAMQYCVGKTLRQISQSEPATVKNEGWLKATFSPILDALELLHAQHCFHRDISPDNILVLQGGGPILLDFGAARQIIGDMTQALTVILKPGFAPIEQYADDASLQQGSWTDVYSVGAVLYYMLMGKPPVASVARLVKDPMIKLADSDQLTGVSRSFRQAIDHALAVRPGERIQSIADLREALQLPTFKPDRQTERWLGTYAEISQTAPGTISEESSSSSGVGLDDDSSSLPIRIDEPQLPPSPEQNTSIAIEASKPNAMAAAVTQFIYWPSKIFRNAVLGIGFLMVAIAVAFVIFHKPLTSVSKNDDIANNQLPANNASGPSSPVDLSIQPSPLETQASTAVAAPTPAEQISPVQSREPANPITVASSDIRNNPSIPALPIKENRGKPSTASNNASEKLPANPTSVSLEHHASMQVTSPTPSSPAAAIISATTKQPAETSSAPVSLKAASLPVSPPSSSPNQTSAVRLMIRPWGQVAVDGQAKGVSPPLTSLSLTPGEHVLVVTNGDFPVVTIPVTVPEKGNIVVSHQFGSK